MYDIKTKSLLIQPGNNTDGRDDYSELPPNQRRKKLQQKIDEFAAKIQQESAARYSDIHIYS